MTDLIDITEELKRRRFNELVLEMLQSFSDTSPEELLILMEEYYNNSEVINECRLFRQTN